jgi:hypothetical protein
MKIFYHLKNSAGWAGITFECNEIKLDYRISYCLGDSLYELLGGMIALSGYRREHKICTDIADKLLDEGDNTFEWVIDEEGNSVKFFFKLFKYTGKVKLTITECYVDEDKTVFDEEIIFDELIENILSSCSEMLKTYGILGYYSNYWVEFPLSYYLMLKDYQEQKIVYDLISSPDNNLKKSMERSTFNVEKNYIIDITYQQGIKDIENRNRVYSDQFCFDMAPWLEQKAEQSIEPIVEVIKLIKTLNIGEKEKIQLLSDIECSLFDMTKVLSFASGGKWDSGDGRLILDNLDEGFEDVKYKYGMILETKKQRIEVEKEAEKQRYNDFTTKIKEYLEFDQFPGRSSLQELFEDNTQFLDRKSLAGRMLILMEDCLFRMANGEIDWETFVSEAKEKLEFLPYR